MNVSEEELLHIAKLANIKLQEEKVDNHLLNLQNILNFTDTLNKAPIEGLKETIGAQDKYNCFRKDEVKQFEDREALIRNAPEQEDNMFKIPKAIS